LKRLASLGYVHMTTGPSPAAGLPDPKDRILALRSYKRLLSLFYGGRDAESIALAREILATDPGIHSAWRILSQSLARSGRLSEAVDVLHGAIALVAGGVAAEEAGQAYEELARLLLRRGDRAGAERLLREAFDRGAASEAVRRELARMLSESGRLEEALAILPALSQTGEPETLATRGAVLAQAGRLKEARGLLLRALAADPENSRVLVHLANLSLREKDPAAAKGWTEKALRIDPRAAAAWSALGTAQVQLGEETGALESWSRAVVEDPSQYDALFNLAVLSGRMGRIEEARRALERFLASAPADRYGARLADARRLLSGLRSARRKNGSAARR
jgi:tetratricopeptide (TPR) repeat protein